jgi:hypothetical protein
VHYVSKVGLEVADLFACRDTDVLDSMPGKQSTRVSITTCPLM